MHSWISTVLGEIQSLYRWYESIPNLFDIIVYNFAGFWKYNCRSMCFCFLTVVPGKFDIQYAVDYIAVWLRIVGPLLHTPKNQPNAAAINFILKLFVATTEIVQNLSDSEKLRNWEFFSYFLVIVIVIVIIIIQC